MSRDRSYRARQVGPGRYVVEERPAGPGGWTVFWFLLLFGLALGITILAHVRT